MKIQFAGCLKNKKQKMADKLHIQTKRRKRGTTMIAVIDYDAGNLKSVEKALIFLGETPVITRDREELLAADKVILPGVGAFGDAMDRLHQYGLVDVIKEVVKKGLLFLASAWDCS